MPKYEAQISLPPLVRGDSQNPFSINIKYKSNDTPVVPDNICSQLRDREGQLVHTFETTTDPITGIVLFKGATPEETRNWVAGRYTFDVQYTVNNKVRTYLKGYLQVVEDISKCR